MKFTVNKDGVAYDCTESSFVNIIWDDDRQYFYFSNYCKNQILPDAYYSIGSMDRNFEEIIWNYALSQLNFDGNFTFMGSQSRIAFYYKSDDLLKGSFVLLDSTSGNVIRSFLFNIESKESQVYALESNKLSMYFLI